MATCVQYWKAANNLVADHTLVHGLDVSVWEVPKDDVTNLFDHLASLQGKPVEVLRYGLCVALYHRLGKV